MTDDYEVLEFTYRKPVKRSAFELNMHNYTAYREHEADCPQCRNTLTFNGRCEYGRQLFLKWIHG